MLPPDALDAEEAGHCAVCRASVAVTELRRLLALLACCAPELPRPRELRRSMEPRREEAAEAGRSPRLRLMTRGRICVFVQSGMSENWS